ncbi:MAG: PD40 domain-containing protein [Planctomycetes bacterium]|nr:PD40 domain-containing protein [Planctomycetota bacterium]
MPSKTQKFGLCLLALVLMASSLTASDALAQQKKRPVKKKAGPAAKRLAVIRGFPKWVTDVAISPDGKTAAAGSLGVVKLIDVPSKRVTATLKSRPGYVMALAFSPDGNRLAVGSYQSLRLWDLKTRKPILDLDGHRGHVTGAAFSPDGKLLASSSTDESARLWDATTGKQIRLIGEHEYPVNGIAFSPDGKWIATAAGDEYRVTRPGVVKVFSAETGKERTWTTMGKEGKSKRLTLVDHLKAATHVVFSADSKVLVSTSLDEKVNVYNLDTGKALGFFDGHGRPTHDAVLTADGKTVISVGGGRARGKNEGKVWNRADGDELATIKGHRGPVSCVALSSDGKTLITGSYDQSVILWDLSPVLPKSKQKAATKKTRRPVVAPKPKHARKKAAKNLLQRLQSRGETKPRSFTAFRLTEKVRRSKSKRIIRVGIIGLDTSHAIAFTKTLNAENPPEDVARCRVVAAYPRGSPDIVSSTKRVPDYTKQMRAMNVEIVNSIPELIKRVDAVLLETNDGRPHLRQILPVLKAGKPVFIDKPIAGSLADAIAIFAAAKKYKVPVFSSSSLRYMPGAQAIRAGKIGRVTSAESYSPAHREKTHPDLFWYGIHGVETLFTMMGTGCQSVKRTINTAAMDEVVGRWKGDRVGTFRGYRKGGKRGYGGSAAGSKGKADAGKYAGYRPLVVEIVKFFRSGKAPVSAAETLEIYAFMEAADESKRQNGAEVTLESVMKAARVKARKRLADLDRK